MLPTEDIIPITYMGGTGGQFLCHFIISAKTKTCDSSIFSTSGNAHFGLKDIIAPALGMKDPDIEKIKIITDSSNIIENSIKPYYTISHASDIELLLSYFKKVIRIIYDNNDIPELLKTYYGKYLQDDLSTTMDFESFARNYNYTLIYWSQKFKHIDSANILCISWKELVRGDTTDLINRISTFTEIDNNNFSIPMLQEWRDKTERCIKAFTL